MSSWHISSIHVISPPLRVNTRKSVPPQLSLDLASSKNSSKLSGRTNAMPPFIFPFSCTVTRSLASGGGATTAAPDVLPAFRYGCTMGAYCTPPSDDMGNTTGTVDKPPDGEPSMLPRPTHVSAADDDTVTGDTRCDSGDISPTTPPLSAGARGTGVCFRAIVITDGVAFTGGNPAMDGASCVMISASSLVSTSTSVTS